jgi:DNA replication and repair protein RecF
MYLRHLTLANFRNYVRLDLRLPAGRCVFWGDNGQGKSNLLEAVYLLATSRSFRTSAERDLVHWYADTNPVFARVVGEVVRHQAMTRLEVIVAESQPPREAPGQRRPANAPASGRASAAANSRDSDSTGPPGPNEAAAGLPGVAPAASVRRRVRVNGHDRPVLDLLGHLNAVLFSPEDVELVAGPAELRRRYLDITLCQIDQRYLRTLRRYLRVLTQRNALLRQQRERPAPPDQFDYWDAQLTDLGAELTVARLRAIWALNRALQAVYPQLTNDPAALRLRYRSSIPLDGIAEPAGVSPEGSAGVVERVRQRAVEHLTTMRPREQLQGVTLAGIHRDDFGFYAAQVDLRTYGSRGQQRTAALALKLAETALMEQTTGDRPVLLLDDVMSELDPTRRAFLQHAIAGHEQVLLTATDLSFFSPDFLAGATRFQVHEATLAVEPPE